MEWRDEIPADAPPVFPLIDGIRRRVNVVLAAIRSLANMRGTNGISVSVANGNILIDGGGAGGALTAVTDLSRRTITRCLDTSLTPAGAIPTSAEIAAAIVAAYVAAGATPVANDTVVISVASVGKLRAVTTLTGTASGLFAVAFTVGSVTYYGQINQMGTW